jgi:glutamyl-tRNA(Gln) amidotransferase subunit E
MAGLLGLEPFPGVRLGKELAEIARTNSLGGVIHSDEFRKQAITEAEESDIRRLTGSDAEGALVLVAGPDERISVVAGLVAERLSDAVRGVPKETRAATEDGETRYLRPRPGAARMYPETDIPEILVTEAMLERVRRTIPQPWEVRVKSYVERYSLSPEMALQLYDSGEAPEFERLAAELKLDRSVIASVLVEVPVRLSREGVDEGKLTEGLLEDVLRSVDRGEFAKEAAVDVLRTVCGGGAEGVDDAVRKLGLTRLSEDELRSIIQRLVKQNSTLIAERGERAFSILMGEVMKSARGRVDGQVVGRILRETIASSRGPSGT